MKTFIRVVECWLPDAGGTMLEFGGGLYGSAQGFGAASRSMCFGRGEGLPGQAWERGRPILLRQLEGSCFRRTRAAAAEGLTSAVALPVFVGETLTAVLVIFCGDDETHAGAIELWHHDPNAGADLVLDDGYYGHTAEVFEFVSRQTAFRKGTGLPGLAWASGLPVFMPDLGKGTRFLRRDSAVRVGINRGLALPCSAIDGHSYVIAFLSALATPIAGGFETWLPDAARGHLMRSEGFCETRQLLGPQGDRVAAAQGAIGRAFADGVPMLTERAGDEPGAVGAGARDAGLDAMVALPVVAGGRVGAVVAWYF